MHDDAKREYAYGPARGLPNSNVGTFTQALHDEARKDGWIVVSMKDEWKRIFTFELPRAIVRQLEVDHSSRRMWRSSNSVS